MASTYKSISPEDSTTVKTRLHEAIPITGSIVSGTYSDNNIKTYAHGMFQSVYDYPYLSSSANHIFDLTVGVSSNSTVYSSVSNQQQKKNNIYNQMAQVLVGYDATGSILPFDRDGIHTDAVSETNKHLSGIFFNFSRLLSKDEIKKGSFSMEFMAASAYAQPATSTTRVKIYDYNGDTNYKVNSPTGEYGILYITNSAGSPIDGTTSQVGGASPAKVGLVFYQAGIAVINPLIFDSTALAHGQGLMSSSVLFGTGVTNLSGSITGSSIDTTSNAIRNRLYNISFNNTTELNSTIYLCRVGSSEFNYSSNPTYLSSSQLRVKNVASDTPVSYFTTIGLYSSDNELLAVAKLSEPMRKDPSQSPTFRVRLDY